MSTFACLYTIGFRPFVSGACFAGARQSRKPSATSVAHTCLPSEAAQVAEASLVDGESYLTQASFPSGATLVSEATLVSKAALDVPD